MIAPSVSRISIIDSHTGGEPTRVVIGGGPELGRGTMAERLAIFRERHDDFRSAVNNEPRGSDVLVSALLCEPVDATCAAGVIFFNNTGYLGMCGHGTIGLVITLAHLGRIRPGVVRIETPVGVVEAAWYGGDEVSLVNVPSHRAVAGVVVEVPGHGPAGDVAWAQLVLPHQKLWRDARAQASARSPISRGASGRRRMRAVSRRSITSNSSARRRPAAMRAASCSAPARPTTVRRAARHEREARLPRRRRRAGGRRGWVQESIIGSAFAGAFAGWIARGVIADDYRQRLRDCRGDRSSTRTIHFGPEPMNTTPIPPPSRAASTRSSSPRCGSA